MIDKRAITIVLQEQKQYLIDNAETKYCTRKEEAQVDINSPQAQIVMGVRRCGKSVLCYNILKQNAQDFAYINFDDERFQSIEAKDLNDILELLYVVYGKFKYLFLDEIQNIDGWHLFVNRLLRTGIHVLVTGSNSKLLSSELATHLTGRNSRITLFPFSFAEYCTFKNVDTASLTTINEAARRKTYDDYLQNGGFPELLHIRDSKKYISEMVANILKRDIVQRFSIKNSTTFEKLAHHLMNIAPSIIVDKELADTFELSKTTVGKFIEYLKQAYLLIGVKKYSTKSVQRIRNEKLYTIDVALMDGRPDAMAGANLGWRLETQVLIELIRRNGPLWQDVYYYRGKGNVEADFVVTNGNTVKEIYQVCYDIENPKTLKREIRGLLTASAETHCDNLFLITDFRREDYSTDGKIIKIRPAYEWLLDLN